MRIPSYTTLNFFLLVALSVFPGLRPACLPVAMANTLSLTATFYGFGWIVDAAFYANMRARHGWSMATFVAGDLALHAVPSLALARDFARRPEAWAAYMAESPFFGLYALLLNLAWGCLAARFSLDSVYVPSRQENWVNAWTLNVAAHVAVWRAMLAINASTLLRKQV